MPLLGRESTEIAEGASDGAAAIRGKAGELRHGSANLLPLFRREVLHGFGSSENPLPLRGGHLVELREAVAHALLDLRRKFMEAGFMLEGTLLVRQRQAAVAVHPLREVFLIFSETDGGLGLGGGTAPGHRLRSRRESDGESEEDATEGLPQQIPGCEQRLHIELSRCTVDWPSPRPG